MFFFVQQLKITHSSEDTHKDARISESTIALKIQSFVMTRRARQCWLCVHSIFSTLCMLDPMNIFKKNEDV